IALSESSRSSCRFTVTSGLISLIVSMAETALDLPTSEVPWMTWRCRLDSSTTSKSTTPSVPTPAAARYISAGEPSPPAPTHSTRALPSRLWPTTPSSGRRVCLLYRRIWSEVNGGPMSTTGGNGTKELLLGQTRSTNGLGGLYSRIGTHPAVAIGREFLLPDGYFLLQPL